MWKLLRLDATAVLEDEMAQKSLCRYFAVSQNKKLAKFIIAKNLPATFTETDSLETLWKEHGKCTGEFADAEHKIDAQQISFKDINYPEKSYLDLKAAIANRILKQCHFCNRKCNVNRVKGETGFCKCENTIEVSSIFPHLGEEPELVPSGTVFTMGCTLRCRHCQNWTISQWIESGVKYSPPKLSKEVERLRSDGCINVNLVGGDPTPWLGHWLETFKHVNVIVPVVWNSNAYYSFETAQLLSGFIDVYLLDFKYGPDDCARKISGVPDYWEVAKRNHLEAKKHGELIIRLLVLPNHLECCTKPIVNWIVEKLGAETRVNIMFQYRPEWKAHEIPELRRKLTKKEIEKAVKLAKKAGLKNLVT